MIVQSDDIAIIAVVTSAVITFAIDTATARCHFITAVNVALSEVELHTGIEAQWVTTLT